jgi:hypothetical protein
LDTSDTSCGEVSDGYKQRGRGAEASGAGFCVQQRVRGQTLRVPH